MKDTTKKEASGWAVAEIKGKALRRYITIEEEMGWLEIRFWEERPDLKHPLLLGMAQFHSGLCEYINVKPSRRRRGYGTLLIDTATKYLKGNRPYPKDIMPTPEADGFWKAQEKR